MIPELGHFALVLAAALALFQSVVPLVGAQRGHAPAMLAGNGAALGQLACVAVAFVCLAIAYLSSDFSVLNVFKNSHTDKPWLYKLSGVWGNHEGSLVLWVLILAIFGAAVALFGENLPATLRARVLSVQGMIGFGFLLFMLLTSNPFTRIGPPVPANGEDLNPLLQDPGLAFHPPFLYLGYVGFSMAFSFAVAALIEGRVDPAWARWVRPWTLVAWASLTLGIGMGSWWAYYELGWGGWWFWDPVENASFMPWLAGTALLHSAIVVEKRDTLKGWTVLLAILTFSLSLMGTFIVRSGVLTSVHAFATDPERGTAILLLLAVATGGALALYAWRAPALVPGGLFRPVSREGSLVLNNLFLSVATLVVLVGTLWPLVLDALFQRKISVGPEFYLWTFVPVTLVLLPLVALGPLMPWKRADRPGILQRLAVGGAALLGACVVAAWGWMFLTEDRTPLVYAAIAAATWLFLFALVEPLARAGALRVAPAQVWRRLTGLPRAAWGMVLAHAGLAVAALGMVCAAVYLEERIGLMSPGETAEIAGYTVTFERVEQGDGPNYMYDRAILTVTRDGAPVAVLDPERRWYPVAEQMTTEAAIHTTWLADVYAALGDPETAEGQRWVIRLWHHPLVPWIWFGTLMCVAGGLVSLADRRLRVGIPTKAAAPARPAPATVPGARPDAGDALPAPGAAS